VRRQPGAVLEHGLGMGRRGASAEQQQKKNARDEAGG